MWHVWGERCGQGFGEITLKERKFETPRHRWENNIKVDLQEIGWRGGVWTGLNSLRTGSSFWLF